MNSTPVEMYQSNNGGVVMAIGFHPVKTFRIRSELYQKQFFELILKLYGLEGLINGYSIVNLVISLLQDPSYTSSYPGSRASSIKIL